MNNLKNGMWRDIVSGVLVILISTLVISMAHITPKILSVVNSFPKLEKKVNTIGIYLAQHPNCEGYTYLQKQMINEDNWEEALTK